MDVLTRYQALDQRHKKAFSSFQQSVGSAKALSAQGKQAVEDRDKASEEALLYEKVSLLFQSLSEEKQEQLRTRIEQLVSTGLKAVFEEDFHFYIKMEVKGAQTVATFTVKDGTGLETDVMSARGGGVASLVGVLLQVVMLVLMRQRVAQIIFLDESFSHLSDEYVPRVASLLRMLSHKLGLQIVLVTHQPEFQEDADRVYRFTKKQGLTSVVLVKG